MKFAANNKYEEEDEMTLCPIAVASSCKACPIFKVCPAKSIIGDHKKNDKESEKQKK